MPAVRAIFRKTIFCEISHFTNVTGNLAYFFLIKDLVNIQVLIALNGINMTPAFLKKVYSRFIFKKTRLLQNFAFTTFPEYFFYPLKESFTGIYRKHLYRYLKY